MWLRSMGTSQVSLFTVSLLFVIETLDLDLYRFDLHSSASTLGSNDPIGPFQQVPTWLCRAGMHPVSCLAVLRLADLCRCGFDSSASPSTPDVSVRTFCVTGGWPRRPR